MHRPRDPRKRQESMSNKWVGIKMEKDDEATKEKEEPDIEKIDEQGARGRV